MSNILKYLIEQPELSDLEIAEKFNYKAPYTKRYKSWLKKCGILENSTKAILTKKGKNIHEKNSQLNDKDTLLYMRAFLTNSEENAEVWHYFHHTFLPKNDSFTKSQLSEAISMKLMPHNPSHFAKNTPMIKVITKVLLDSYLSENAFGSLKIIEIRDDVFSKVN